MTISLQPLSLSRNSLNKLDKHYTKKHAHGVEMSKKDTDLVSEPQQGEIIVYQSEDGQIKLDGRLQDETVWLTQQLIAELFQTTVPNISMHIRNIYDECELTPEATVKKFLIVRREGD
jgi:hypothetical protein